MASEKDGLGADRSASRASRKSLPGQKKVGMVVGIPGTKTVKVRVERQIQHPVYKRYIRRSKQFIAHDEAEQCVVGDKIEIIETRPLSATKRWRVLQIIIPSRERALEANAKG